MAIDSFKREIWEAGLLLTLHKQSVAELIATKPLATKPSQTNGSKVIFNVLTTGAIKDYTGTIEWDDITTAPIELVFDKKKVWAISLDDLDKIQAVKDLTLDVMTDEAAKLREVEDTDFLAEAVKGAATTLGKSKAITLNTKNVYDNIVDMGTILSKNKVPVADRFVVVDAEILGLLAKDDRFTRNPVVLENGIVEGQKINGLQVVSCEELPANTILAVHKGAVGFGRQLDKVEALRLQNSFADGIRGLDCYGSKTLRSKNAVALKYTLENAIQQ